MRWLITLLVFLFIFLQYPLWLSDSSLPDAWRLQDKIEVQVQDNKALEERNRLLKAEVEDLKNGLEVVEEKARTELGLIKEGETYFQVIERPAESEIDVQVIEVLPENESVNKERLNDRND